MPMPHQTQWQLIKRGLVGKKGSERVRYLRAVLDDLPGYKNGPYADLRKWVLTQIEETRVRSRVVQRDSIAVRREGAAQVALVGAPNAGKSSLLEALSHVQIKIGAYAFTTLRPVPALTRIHGVLIQLVEIPGLIAGSARDRGGGRALLGVLRGADAIVYCQDSTAPPDALQEAQAEVAAAGIDLRAIVAATKLDEASQGTLANLGAAFPNFLVIGVSVLDDASLDAFRDAVWKLTGLICVYLRHNGVVDAEPLALSPGATIADIAAEIHKDVGAVCHGARVWGLSTRFEGQRVGRAHEVQDGDIVEVLV